MSGPWADCVMTSLYVTGSIGQGLRRYRQSHGLDAQSTGAIHMTEKNFIGSTRDSAYMAITEVMGLAADAMDANPSDTLLVISLSGGSENAIVGGTLDSPKITRLQAMLDELKWRAANEGDGDKVLHVWR